MLRNKIKIIGYGQWRGISDASLVGLSPAIEDGGIVYYERTSTIRRCRLSSRRDIRRRSEPRGKLAFEFLLGRGMPLNPYLRGKMIASLRKELKLAPDELLFDGQV